LQLLLAGAMGDVFLHMPRGSNNRLNEATNNRANNNRLFDSQNNGQGGYNVGDGTSEAATDEAGQHKAIFFQSGREGVSQLAVEWWNQHGCGKRNDRDPHSVDCQIVLQFNCQEEENSNLKNGFSTNKNGHTESSDEQETFTQKTERKAGDYERKPDSGEHESWEYYDSCFRRDRNRGIFTADQTRNNNRGSTRTRQNPGGTRRGYECPEERDYFPYWHPTPWTDIAVLTSQMHNCDFYREESGNRKGKGECVEYYPDSQIRKHYSTANNELDCAKSGGNWTEFFNFLEIIPNVNSESDCRESASDLNKEFGEEVIWNIPYLDGEARHLVPAKKCLVLAPEILCEKAPWSRANHLGNGKDDDLPNFKWNLPHFHFLDGAKECVLRIRYNISSNDYEDPVLDHRNENNYFKMPHLENDPVVELYPKLQLQLALDSQQVGRTFQDRTHIFQIRERPSSIPDSANLYNIGVRGRRGNIQQTFPALEYDYSPTSSSVSGDDYVHIQWEGSNTQPPNQAGEGRDQTDRNNLVQVYAPNWNIPAGKVVGDEVQIFTVSYEDREERFEYRTFRNIDIKDARILCAQYGMGMPEPRDATFNEQLKEFWTVDGEFRGIIFLGISDEEEEGDFRYNSDGASVGGIYENWAYGKPNNGGDKANEHYAVMYTNGKWDDWRAGQKTGETLCLKPYEEPETEPEPKNMFEDAVWAWSSVTQSQSVLNSTENLLIQMASSGYYHCKEETDCELAMNKEGRLLQSQLDNAPASFHGNVVKFAPGQYFFLSSRNNNFSNRAQKGFIKVD